MDGAASLRHPDRSVQQGDGEAEPLLARALAILEKSLPPNHPHQVQFRESYAALLDQLGRTDEASELRVQAEVIRQQREQPPPSP